MSLFPLRRRTTTGVGRKTVTHLKPGGDAASVAKSVLNFLSLGLTNGAEYLAEHYQPREKVEEYVTVSNEIITALKREHDNRYANDSVTMFMKVNGQQKRIELTQYGQHVMMSLDGQSVMINNMTLPELYANIRYDMIHHPEIFGKERQRTAMAFPEPRK
jgi:hypothetical protein